MSPPLPGADTTICRTNYIVQRAGDARSPGFSRKRPNPSRLKAELPTTELPTTELPTTIVALIDTGIDANHHALKHTLSPNDGWNFITTNDNNSADDNGHGTQVAGIITQSEISNLQSSIKLLHDELSRLKIVTLPDNNTRQHDYTGCGCAGNSQTRATDEMGHSTKTKTDFLKRLSEAQMLNPVGEIYSKAEYVYDELDRLIEIRHSNGSGAKIQTRSFSFDGYGRLQSETTPEGGTVTYTYKANDLLWTAANQRNITVTNSYNTRNLLEQVSYSDGTPTATFGYDAFGARNSMTDGEGSASYAYNSYRQLESETRTFGGLPGKSFVLTYAYNLADQLKSVNYNYVGGGFNKNVNYAYNSVGALSGVGTNLIGSDPNATANVLNTVAYRGSGALKSLNYGNGRRLQMDYYTNRQQQPFSMKVDRASNPSDKIIDYAYQYYDANGKNNNRIRKITDNLDTSYTTDYTYSDYDRLIGASAPAYTRSYGSDEWGNLVDFAGLTLNYATNASGAPATNRISTAVAGSTTYTHSYDAAGNMTGDGQQTYSYDGANRLKEVGTGGQNTYGYDGNGMRVRVVSGGGLPTFYIRSSVLGQVAFEVNQNLVLRSYVYAGNNKLVAQQSRDGQFYWVHTNHLGSGIKLTDSSGTMKYRAEFAPYGEAVLEWSASGDTYLNTKKFTGYERDEATGLDYANARMYHQWRGRFVQPDPVGQKAANLSRPQSLNRYSYAQGDPVNFVDPGGTCLFFWNQVSERYGNWEAILCHITEDEPRGPNRSQKKKTCPPNFDKQVVVAGYLLAAGLDGEDQESSPVSTVADSARGGGFLLTFKAIEMRKVLDILQKSGLFEGGTFGGRLHEGELKDKFGDLGSNVYFEDYRSKTTLTIGDQALGTRSLQVTLYFDKNDKNKIIGAYADTDAENFREGLGPLLVHGVKTGISKIGNWLGRKCD
ncbi:MAG: RHS repeat-associated core domain-containing protein [Blastocatellia bacterium]